VWGSRQRMECDGLPPLCEEGWNPAVQFQATAAARGVDGNAHPIVGAGWFSSVRRPGVEPGFQPEAMTTGRSRDARCSNGRRVAARGKRWPSMAVDLGERQERRVDRRAQRWKEGLSRGVAYGSCREDPCWFEWTGQFWAPAREEAVLGSEPAGATSAGACCSGTAAPPKVQSQGSQKYAPQGATRWKKPLDPWDSGA